MRLFNFHADTPYRMYRHRLPFDSPTLAAGGVSHLPFREATELYAVWSDRRLSDAACWTAFFRIVTHFRAALARSKARIPQVFLTVEDARLLCSDLSRLSVLRAAGVATLTLVWGGESIIGGAHGMSSGLTEFGRETVRQCFSLGIVPDLSHASERTFAEVLELAREAGKPAIASHSDFRTVADHTRNLTDRQYLDLAAQGGVCGICLEPTHLRTGGNATLDDVVAQIEHGLALAPQSLVLGTDFDGIDETPAGLPDTSALPRLADRLLARGHPDSLVESLFWGTGAAFAERYLPPLPSKTSQ